MQQESYYSYKLTIIITAIFDFLFESNSCSIKGLATRCIVVLLELWKLVNEFKWFETMGCPTFNI